MKSLLKKIALVCIVMLFATKASFAISVNKHGAGTAYPNVHPGETISSFYYSVIPGNCEITVSNLAPGIEYSITRGADSSRVDIFGTAAEEIGRYKFRVTANKNNESASRSGTITISGKLAFTDDTDFLEQTLIEGDSIHSVKVKFKDNVKVSTLLQDGIDFKYNEETNSGIVYGCPKRIGMSYIRIYAERNGYKDTLFINIETNKDGLLKESAGNLKQVVHINEEISPILFKWECQGTLSYENNSDDIDISVDNEYRTISISGTPSSLGRHTASIRFETKRSLTEYKVEIIAIEDTTPTLSIVSNESTIEQVVPYRAKIDEITINIQDADSINITSLPVGIYSSYDDEQGILSIYGTMRENALFEITITAYNRGRETALTLRLSTIDGDITSILSSLAEKHIYIDRIEVTDLQGRVVCRYSQETFDVELLPKGISIVAIHTSNGIISKKVMK